MKHYLHSQHNVIKWIMILSIVTLIGCSESSVSSNDENTNEQKGALNWEEALEWAESLEYAGYSDWRLPNAKELQNIVDYTRSPSTSETAAIDVHALAVRFAPLVMMRPLELPLAVANGTERPFP